MKISNYTNAYQIYNKSMSTTNKTTAKNIKSVKDSISLSPEVTTMQELTAKVKQTPDIRETKINEIKQQIANGTYNVPIDDFVEKLVSKF